MSQKSKDLSIIVYSCKKNSDMWDIFITFFKKYWNDCKYKLILLTDYDVENSASKYFDEVVCLDGTYYEMISTAVKKAETPYVMLFMDDYLMAEKVNNEDIDKYIEAAKKYKAANIRFEKSDIIKSYNYNEEFEYFKAGTAYSVTTQAGIWDAVKLLEYLKPEWSAWDFERKGSFEINEPECPLLVPKNYKLPYVEGVRQGKWMKKGVKVLEKNNVHPDYNRRPKMGFKDNFKVSLKGFIIKCNPNLVVKLQNKLGK